MGGHSPLPAPEVSQALGVGGGGEEAQGRRGWGRFLSPFPRGLFSPWAKSSPAPSFLLQSGRRLGSWDGGLDSSPDLTRWASAPAPRPRENRTRPTGSCNPIPRAGRARARAAAAARPGRRVGFQREPLGTSVERTDAAASHGPGAPAARPPPACSCRLLPRCAARPRGRQHLGHRPLLDSRDAAPSSPESPSLTSLRASSPQGLAEGWMFAHTPGVPITWRRLRPLGLFVPL